MNAYRLEWIVAEAPETRGWSIHLGRRDAAAALGRLLQDSESRPPWVRIVLTNAGGDVADRFVDPQRLLGWPPDEVLPVATLDEAPIATPETDRLRARAIAGLDVVLRWAMQRHLIAASAAASLRLAFDAALLGIGDSSGLDGGGPGRRR